MNKDKNPARARAARALLTGAFGGLFAVALTGILLAFVALRESGSAGVIALVVTFVIGLTIGFAYEWRRAGANSLT